MLPLLLVREDEGGGGIARMNEQVIEEKIISPQS